MTDALEMPRFNDQVQLSDAEFTDALKPSGGKVFKPGRYDVTIDEADWKKSKSDDRWISVKVGLKGAGEKEIREFLLVPLANTTRYRGATGKETTYPFKKFVAFCEAIGVQVGANTLAQVVKSHFYPVKKLVGKNLTVNIGYQAGHVEFNEKDTEGNSTFKIVLADGNVLVDPNTNQPVLFSDRAAAAVYAKDNNLDVDDYPSVLSYEKSAMQAAVGADANW